MTAVIAPETVLLRNHRAVHRDLADGSGAVILNLDTGAYHGANRTGSLIWSLLEDGPTFESLMAELRQRLTGTPPTFEAEIAAFLLGLRDRDLVRFDLGDRAAL